MIQQNHYKPSYVWPNPAFPFRVYYEGAGLRIFIIENIHHNWEWLSTYANRIRENDYFFVLCGWYHSESFSKEADLIFSLLSLNKNQFFFLFNSQHEQQNLTSYGFQGDLINQNAWLDYNSVMRPEPVTKKLYDAIYVARFSPFKRHFLASKVPNMALVAGNNHGNALSDELPAHSYLNDEPLTPEQVCHKINQSVCGLILSAEEGACFASSEYLLCGIPVVSTRSEGGRDVWYNEYNAIICDDSAEDVARAVEYFNSHRCDPERIRSDYIEQSNGYRDRFINHLQQLFDQHGENVDAGDYFEQHFMHKMRRSYKPDFTDIFQ